MQRKAQWMKKDVTYTGIAPSTFETVFVLLRKKRKCKDILKRILADSYNYLHENGREEEFFEMLPMIEPTQETIDSLVGFVISNERYEITDKVGLLEKLKIYKKDDFEL